MPTNEMDREGPDPKPYYASAFWIGTVAACIMMGLLWVARRAGVTELDLPMSLGTVSSLTLGETPGARAQGLIAAIICGGVFAIPYAWLFEHWKAHKARAWMGAAAGICHAVIGGAMLGWLMPILHTTPVSDPRVADPGFMGSNYGLDAMIIFGLAHIVYGGVVGGWMHFSRDDTKYLEAVAKRDHHDHPHAAV